VFSGGAVDTFCPSEAEKSLIKREARLDRTTAGKDRNQIEGRVAEPGWVLALTEV
jgi:hypothetical protein